MKKLIVILALFLSCASIEARNVVTCFAPAADPCAGYLVCEDFEGTGTPTGWSKSASYFTFDSTSPTPLEGSQSAAETSTQAYQDGSGKYTFGAAQANLYLYFIMRMNDVDGTGTYRPFFIAYSGAKKPVYLAHAGGTSTQIRVYEGSTYGGDYNVGLSEDTIKHFWVEYTSSNSTFNVYVSSTTTKPSTPSVTASGDCNGSVDSFTFMAAEGMTAQFDHVRVSSTPIGSNPS